MFDLGAIRIKTAVYFMPRWGTWRIRTSRGDFVIHTVAGWTLCTNMLHEQACECLWQTDLCCWHLAGSNLLPVAVLCTNPHRLCELVSLHKWLHHKSGTLICTFEALYLHKSTHWIPPLPWWALFYNNMPHYVILSISRLMNCMCVWVLCTVHDPCSTHSLCVSGEGEGESTSRRIGLDGEPGGLLSDLWDGLGDLEWDLNVHLSDPDQNTHKKMVSVHHWHWFSGSKVLRWSCTFWGLWGSSRERASGRTV